MRQLFSGTAERIFMKLLPNDRGECSLKRCAAAWRMANVDLRNLRYDFRNHQRAPRNLRYDWRHARRLRYTTMSAERENGCNPVRSGYVYA